MVIFGQEYMPFMLFILLCFSGLMLMFFFLLRGMDVLLRELRQERNELVHTLRGMERRLALLGAAVEASGQSTGQTGRESAPHMHYSREGELITAELPGELTGTDRPRSLAAHVSVPNSLTTEPEEADPVFSLHDGPSVLTAVPDAASVPDTTDVPDVVDSLLGTAPDAAFGTAFSGMEGEEPFTAEPDAAPDSVAAAVDDLELVVHSSETEDLDAYSEAAELADFAEQILTDPYLDAAATEAGCPDPEEESADRWSDDAWSEDSRTARTEPDASSFTPVSSTPERESDAWGGSPIADVAADVALDATNGVAADVALDATNGVATDVVTVADVPDAPHNIGDAHEIAEEAAEPEQHLEAPTASELFAKAAILSPAAGPARPQVATSPEGGEEFEFDSALGIVSYGGHAVTPPRAASPGVVPTPSPTPASHISSGVSSGISFGMPEMRPSEPSIGSASELRTGYDSLPGALSPQPNSQPAPQPSSLSGTSPDEEQGAVQDIFTFEDSADGPEDNAEALWGVTAAESARPLDQRDAHMPPMTEGASESQPEWNVPLSSQEETSSAPSLLDLFVPDEDMVDGGKRVGEDGEDTEEVILLTAGDIVEAAPAFMASEGQAGAFDSFRRNVAPEPTDRARVRAAAGEDVGKNSALAKALAAAGIDEEDVADGERYLADASSVNAEYEPDIRKRASKGTPKGDTRNGRNSREAKTAQPVRTTQTAQPNQPVPTDEVEEHNITEFIVPE